jgi:hypothetical protein
MNAEYAQARDDVTFVERRQRDSARGIGGVIARARDFLENDFRAALAFTSEISAAPDMSSPQPAPTEVFSSMLILELMAQRALHPGVTSLLYGTVRLALRQDRIHFFTRPELLPADIDCTSIGAAVLYEGDRIDRNVADAVAGAVVANVNADGVLVTYFPSNDGQPQRDYVEAAVCCNALYFLHLLERGHEAEKSERFVREFLVSGAWRGGTRYYHSPDAFLFFASRLAGRFASVRAHLGDALASALDERVGASDDALDVALRVHARQRLGLADAGERVRLLDFAHADDGSFPSSALFRAGKRATFFGSRALTTAFAVAGLERRAVDATRASRGEPASYYAPTT